MTSEIFKEYKQEIDKKVEKLSDELIVQKDDIRTLDTNIQNHVIGCGLEAYKSEMRERCERLNEKLNTNKETIIEHKHENETSFSTVNESIKTKIDAQRRISNKIISTAVIFAVCLVGVFSGININKVSHSEFKQHIETSNTTMEKQISMMDRFIDSYSDDRIRRESKLEKMFERQLNFNQSIMKNTTLLEKQLEVIKTQMKLHQKNNEPE